MIESRPSYQIIIFRENGLYFTIPDPNAIAPFRCCKIHFDPVHHLLKLFGFREKILARERKDKFENFSSLDEDRISSLYQIIFRENRLYFTIPDPNATAPFRCCKIHFDPVHRLPKLFEKKFSLEKEY